MSAADFEQDRGEGMQSKHPLGLVGELDASLRGAAEAVGEVGPDCFRRCSAGDGDGLLIRILHSAFRIQKVNFRVASSCALAGQAGSPGLNVNARTSLATRSRCSTRANFSPSSSAR